MNGGDWYDVMQVCLNGHQITEHAKSQPMSRQNHCANCGERTIEACPACNAPIRGYRHIEGVFHITETPIPKYCIDCGKPYPWQVASLDNLHVIIREGNLTPQDIQEFDAALPDLLNDTPKTEGASLKIKRILGKLGRPLYEIAIKVTTDVASEAAKKVLEL